MTADSTTLTREQLHELVWTNPMIRLGKRFGISDVGLRKICRRLDVPTPPAGWWAKKAAGHRVKVAPLPEWRAGIAKQATITPSPDQEEGLRGAIRRQAQRVGEIAIPERLPRPHPLIAGWIADHRRRQQEARRERDPWFRDLHRVPDLTPAERRRHRVLHALFRGLEKHGATISENDRRQLVATLAGEDIAFVVHEKVPADNAADDGGRKALGDVEHIGCEERARADGAVRDPAGDLDRPAAAQDLAGN